MLLRAIESGRFTPLGSDREVRSRFQLIAGTNRDLQRAVAEGRFRDDLLARLDLWTFHLPGLRQRPEDIPPNLDYELNRITRETGRRVTMNAEARARFLEFACSAQASWSRNFRDLNGAMRRMATLAEGGRIDQGQVEEEMARLLRAWTVPGASAQPDVLRRLLGAERLAQLDRVEQVQLAEVVAVCGRSASLAAAGRALFAASRQQRRSVNDGDRLRKYLARYGLSWAGLNPEAPSAPTSP